MRRLNIIAGIVLLVTLLMISSLVYAKLSDETLEIVDDLRWKHEFGTLITSDSLTGILFQNDCAINYKWTSFYFKDGKLFVETQDGKWFIEMKKLEE